LVQSSQLVNLPAEKRDWRLMRRMFSTVAPRYDFITRVFSYGMDARWKRAGVARVQLPENAVVLDLASGTGDFSTLIKGKVPGANTVAVDLTERMLHLARGCGVEHGVCADAAALPFVDGTFDAVFVGYGLRNFTDLRRAVAEIGRVTRRGGVLISLDFFLPARPIIRKLYLGYLYAQGAFWGLLLHGRPRVYTYIPASLRGFVSIEDFSTLLRKVGYGGVEARRYILGGIGLHWAAKE
jgi:demethylmenaquinone methyltransferase / 2-methoxy-6-polyprenyl-1,4-benzoquinol methylase